MCTDSVLDYVSQVADHNINSVTLFTDAANIRNSLQKPKNQLKDVYIAKEINEIKLLLIELKKAIPKLQVDIRYIGSSSNQLHQLAHRLSRCYKGKVSTFELIPAAPFRFKVYPYEFRLRAVAEARAGAYCETARKYGIAISTLYRWRQKLTV